MPKFLGFGLILVVFVFAKASHGATVEFTFAGVYTQTTGTVHQVGNAFTSTLVFDPATIDVDSNPEMGSYAHLGWTAPSTASQPYNFPPSGAIRIGSGGSGSNSWILERLGASTFFWHIDLIFPNGTFLDDSLPTSLDLSQATLAQFRGTDVGVTLRGNITSLTINPTVPEPAAGIAVLISAFAFRRRRRLH